MRTHYELLQKINEEEITEIEKKKKEEEEKGEKPTPDEVMGVTRKTRPRGAARPAESRPGTGTWPVNGSVRRPVPNEVRQRAPGECGSRFGR